MTKLSIKNWFCEANGKISWRTILTAEAGFLFAIAVVGYLIKHKFEELPDSYQLIISGVFGFYFLKRLFGKEDGTDTQKSIT